MSQNKYLQDIDFWSQMKVSIKKSLWMLLNSYISQQVKHKGWAEGTTEGAGLGTKESPCAQYPSGDNWITTLLV